MEIQSKSKTIGYICALTATMFWGLHSNIIRYLIGEGLEPMNIALIRVWAGALVLWIVGVLFFQIHRPSSIPFKYNTIFFIGVIGFSLNFIFFHKSLEFTFASHALLIESFSPVFVLLLGLVFIKKRFSHLINSNKLSKLMLIVALGSIGSSLLLFETNSTSTATNTMLGDTLAAISTFFFAMFFISNSEVRKTSTHSSLSITIRYLSTAGLLFLPFIKWNEFANISPTQWVWLAIVSIGCTGFTYFLWNYASYSLEVTPLTIIFNLGAINTIIVESLFFDFTITWKVVISGIMILLTSFLAERMNANASIDKTT